LNVGCGKLAQARMTTGRNNGQAARKPGLRLRLLGELGVFRGDKRLDLPPSRKTRALLVYLMATGRPHTRDHLCNLLWDGPDDPRAQLRWSLTKLRPLVDDEHLRLRADRDRIEFQPAGAEIDLEIVRRLERRGLATASTDDLLTAANSFAGAFVDGLDLSSCHRFHAWCVALREEMHALHVGLRVTLIERLRATPEMALRHARALLELDPLAESSHVTMVRLLGGLGRTREALEQYQRCRELLDRELGGKPSREMEETRMAIGQTSPQLSPPMESPLSTTRSSPLVVSTVSAVTTAVAVPPPESPRVEPVPLFGRQAERALLAQKLDDVVAGRGSEVLLLLGDAGIGKSRLLEELVYLARNAGGRVLSGRAFEAELVRPYGAWIDALRAGDLPASRALGPLLPELDRPRENDGEGAADRAGDVKGRDRERDHLFEAVAGFLVSRACEQPPLLVVIDDVQWLDEASAALLHFVARASAGQPVLIACAARPGEMEDNSAVLRLVRTLDRDRRLLRMPLPALDADATAALVAAIANGVDAAAVFEGSEGNPLFAIEMSRARGSGTGDGSRTLAALITERLERLDERARQLLPFAAALGRSFDPQILARVVSMPITELLGALDDLERRRVVRATGANVYDFSHDMVRQAAYQQLSEPRRRLIHLQLARAFAAMPDPDATLASDLAHHAGLGGDDQTAARAYLAAAQRSARLFAWGEAGELARRGGQHLGQLPRPVRLHLHVELLGAEVSAKPAKHRTRDLDLEILRVISEAEQAGFHADAARGYYFRSVLQFRHGDTARATETSMRGAVAAERSADPIAVARSKAEAGRCLMILERETAKAKTFLEEALEVLVDDQHDLILDWGLGLLHRYTGDAEHATRRLERASLLSSRIQSHWEESECLRTLALLALERGDFGQARARCPLMLEVASKMGEGSERAIAIAIDHLARMLDGDADADEPLERALDEVRAVDAKTMLSTLLNFAAEHDLVSGLHQRARRRADEALWAATAVERKNQMAIARSILARIEMAAGNCAAAEAHLAPVRPDLDVPLALSVQARDALTRAIEGLVSLPAGASPNGREIRRRSPSRPV
jgi:DNA-binding SARP family transcriptional activator/tetratricopeptide (TPR) repeat protein